MAYEMVCSCFRGCGAYGSCWFSGRAFGATRSSVLRTSTPQATRSPASFHTCSNPSSSWSSGSPVSGSLATGSSFLQFSGPPVSRPFALGSRFPVLLDPLAPAPWLRLPWTLLALFAPPFSSAPAPGRRLFAGLLGFDALRGVGHLHQALLRNELAGGLADAVGLVLDTDERHLEVADELHLMGCQTAALLL